MDHFNLWLVVKKAGREVCVSNVYVVWHVLSKCVGRILSNLEVIINLTIHTLIEIKLADVSILDFLHIQGKFFISKLQLLLNNLLHLLFEVVYLSFVAFSVFLVREL